MRRLPAPFIACLLACAGLGWVRAVVAQEVALEPPAEGSEGAKVEETEHPKGVYTGVKPGGNEPPAVPAKAGSTPALVTWPGFQMRPDGSSRVFVQTTVPVDTASSTQPGAFVIELGDVQVKGDTNRFPLLTQHFNTPVTKVEVKRAGKRTTLVLSLRAEVAPKVSTERAQSGFFFVYVDFPAGVYATPAKPDLSASAPRPTDGAALDQATAPSHLEGDVAASAEAKAGARVEAGAARAAEVPPGMAKPKAKAKAKASGKAKIGL